MKFIVSVIEYISEFLKSIADFVVNYFKNIIKFFTAIPEVIEIMNSCVAWLPTYVVTFALEFIAVSILFLIIRRN